MAATILDGRNVASRLLGTVAQEAKRLTDAGRQPGLAVILIGGDPASDVYVRHKVAACGKCGIHSFEYRLPATAAQEDVAEIIRRLNKDPAVHGILLQLPLPGHMDAGALIRLIEPGKDVDGLHPLNIGRLVAGEGGIVPCTPLGALRLIHTVQENLSGLHAVVIGCSLLLGKPMGVLLLAQDCTVTLTHSRTRDLPSLCRQADILVAAAGQPELVQGDWIKPGAIVIDVGITRMDDGTLKGDVDFQAALDVARAITPVPGGVGPMTVACLMENTVQAAGKQV